MDEPPPRRLPLAQTSARPPIVGSGSAWYFQSKSGSWTTPEVRAGTFRRMCSPLLPASSSSTLTPAAASRPAMAQPAEPPPVTMISASATTASQTSAK